MIRSAVLLVSLAVALPASAAEIYSWKDKDGRIIYSDMPPPSGDVKILLRGRAAPPAPDTGATPAGVADDAKADAAKPKSTADRDLEFRQRRTAEAEAQAKADKEAAAAAERQRHCEQARSQLSALQAGQRIARPNAAGEREFLDDAARAEETSRVQRQIEQTCR